jgi:hypothetical protein
VRWKEESEELGVVLQERDLSVLLFALEMHFCDVASVGEMYFECSGINLSAARTAFSMGNYRAGCDQFDIDYSSDLCLRVDLPKMLAKNYSRACNLNCV